MTRYTSPKIIRQVHSLPQFPTYIKVNSVVRNEVQFYVFVS